MKREKILKRLMGSLQDGFLLTVKRDEGYGFHGVVVGIGAEWILLHTVNTDIVCFNGYTALRIEDVKTVKVSALFLSLALALRGEQPAPSPNVSLASLPELLVSADAHFPLLTLHPERLYPDECFIGRVAQLTEKAVQLRELDVHATWRKRLHRHRLKDITRVDFGGGYENALWKLAKHDISHNEPS